jgi:hypothetical protein
MKSSLMKLSHVSTFLGEGQLQIFKDAPCYGKELADVKTEHGMAQANHTTQNKKQ